MHKYFVPSEDSVDQLGLKISQWIKEKKINVVTLTGELGSGKTTLCRSIVNGYFGGNIRVYSPTFTLLNVYGEDKKIVYHYDLYRLKTTEELLELGIEEALEVAGLLLFEWPGLASHYLSKLKAKMEIEICFAGETQRNVKIIMPS